MKRFFLIALTVLFIGCNMETQDVKTLETSPASTLIPSPNDFNSDDYQDNPDGVSTFINPSPSVVEIKFITEESLRKWEFDEVVATEYVQGYETGTFTYKGCVPIGRDFSFFRQIKHNVFLVPINY